MTASTALLYQRVSGFDFVNYDDHVLLRDNTYVTRGLSRGT